MQAPSAFRRRLPGEANQLFDDDLPADFVPAILLAAPPPAPVFAAPTALTQAIAQPGPNRVGTGAAQAMLADRAAASFGLTGKGVKIGILSDSFNLKGGLAENIRRGEIGAATILKEGPRGGSDEGRAMAELIHRIAPDAEVVFYSAFWGEADFARGITALAAAGCDVIVDDVTYLAEPFFQDGANVQRAVQQVVGQGVSYFTSAGNAGANFYQASFAGTKATLQGLAGSYLVQNFGSAGAPKTTQSLTIARGATTTLSLQWDQPFASIGTGRAAANSLGMVLYDSNNRIVAYTLANDVGGNPTQTLQFTNRSSSTAFGLAIVANGGKTPPGQFKYIAYGQGTVINDPNAGRGSGTLTGHALVAEANTVGAMAYYNARAFGGRQIMESFSAVGPGTLLFDAKGNRTTKPQPGMGVDFTAPDGSATSASPPSSAPPPPPPTPPRWRR